jgi:hypothetical protein
MESESKFIRRRRSTILIILTLSLLAAPARGYWYNDTMIGMANVCLDPNEQDSPNICQLGSNKYLACWLDRRITDIPRMYYQVINSNGVSLLNSTGNPIIEGNWITTGGNGSLLMSDGLGGAILVFRDMRSGYYRIYSQRFDSLGNRLWGENGLPLVEWTGSQDVHLSDVSYDTLGNFFVSWSVEMTITNGDLYIQKFTREGQRLWGNYGIPVCTEPHFQMNQQIVPDGVGGVVSVWEDQRAGGDYFRFYMQHLHPEGFSMLQENGVMLTLPTGGYLSGGLYDGVSDGEGGGIYTYITNFADNFVHVFRVNVYGRVPWDWSNWTLCQHEYLDMLRHPADGTVWVSVADEQSNTWTYRLYHFDVNGTPLLGDQGIPCGGMLALVSDGIYSASFEYIEPTERIWVKRLRHSGTLVWESILASFDLNVFSNLQGVSNGMDGAVWVWEDNRNMGGDYFNILSQQVLNNGFLGSSNPGPRKTEKPEVGINMMGQGSYQLSLEQAGILRLELYNIMGQRVRTFFNGYHDAGDFTLRVDTDGLISGVYILQLSTSQARQAVKLVVTK